MVLTIIYLKIRISLYKLHNIENVTFTTCVNLNQYLYLHIQRNPNFLSECPVGYYRLNCSEQCIYPTYGGDCQSECKCSPDKCNFVTGCSQGQNEATGNQRLRMHTLYMRFLPFKYSIILVHVSLEANIKTGLFQL